MTTGVVKPKEQDNSMREATTGFMELDDMNARIEARIGDAHGEDTSAEDAPAK